jgi:predicted GIY-YIG superfamily endonuclease
MAWNIYIMEVMSTSKKNMGKIEYYTGIAYSPSHSTRDVLRNIVRRFHEHRCGYKSNWMNYTKKVPRRMVYIENSYKDKKSAEIREKEIKTKGRKYKIKIIKDFKENNPYLVNYIDSYFYRYARFCY